MALLTRRDFTTISAYATLTAFVSKGTLSCTHSPSGLPSNTPPLVNKLNGMVLLGTYGDVLGAFHEPSGLQGNIGMPDALRKLPMTSSYQSTEKTGAPWWVWVDGKDIPPGTIGVPTDDSAYRLLILHPWLTSVENEPIEETRFRQWLQAEYESSADVLQGSWQERKRLQIKDWLIMLDDAQRWKAASADASFETTPGNPFFRPEIPVVFGMFMYLECAALYAHCPPNQVRDHFTSFCGLDQGYAGEITGLFAALIADAMVTSPEDHAFNEWYMDTLRSLLSNRDVSVGNETLSEIVDDAWGWGSSKRALSEQELLEALRLKIYQAPLPEDRDSIGFRVFDPLLFLKQITATVAYSPQGIQQILTLLACNPGDADTIPSMLGSVAGAWYGLDALKNLSPTLSEDLDAVHSTVSSLFGYDLGYTTRAMAALSTTLTCP